LPGTRSGDCKAPAQRLQLSETGGGPFDVVTRAVSRHLGKQNGRLDTERSAHVVPR